MRFIGFYASLFIFLVCLQAVSLNAMFVKTNIFDVDFKTNSPKVGSSLDLSVGLLDFGFRKKYTLGISGIFNAAMGSSTHSYSSTQKDYNSSVAYSTGSALYKFISNDGISGYGTPLKAKLEAIEGASTFSGYMLTLNYDIASARGLYVFGGIGQGKENTVKKGNSQYVDAMGNLMQFVKEYSAIKDNDKDAATKREKVITAYVGKDSSKKMFDALKNNTSGVKELISNMFQGGKSINGTFSSVGELVSNEDKRKDFYTKVSGSLPSYKSYSSFMCNQFVDCKDGLAYQAGIGYDYQIWRNLGADAYTKVYGLFNSVPIVASGINVSIVW